VVGLVSVLVWEKGGLIREEPKVGRLSRGLTQGKSHGEESCWGGVKKSPEEGKGNSTVEDFVAGTLKVLGIKKRAGEGSKNAKNSKRWKNKRVRAGRQVLQRSSQAG